MWYVVQVSTGHEDVACRLIEQTVDADILQECFVPKYRTAEKVTRAGSVGGAGGRARAGGAHTTSAKSAASTGSSTTTDTAGSSGAHTTSAPTSAAARNTQSAWVPCTKILFPGYLMVCTNHVADLDAQLRRVKAFTKLLRTNNAFIPLSSQEIEWIDSYTQRGNRVIGMSEGYLEDGKVHVTSGPLLGMEGRIRKVNHRKKRVYLELEMFGRTIKAELGLKIVRKRT